MYTVMAIQYQCGQTFSTHLVGGKLRPVSRGLGAQPRDFLLRFW